MSPRPVFTTYYGKRYRAVYTSSSRKKANVIAHSLMIRLKDDMEVKEKVTVLLIHESTDKHVVFVKEPYDKMIKHR